MTCSELHVSSAPSVKYKYSKYSFKHQWFFFCSLSEQTSASAAESEGKLSAAQKSSNWDERRWVTNTNTKHTHTQHTHTAQDCSQWPSGSYSSSICVAACNVTVSASASYQIISSLYWSMMSSSYLLCIRERWFLPERPHAPLNGGPWAAEDRGSEDGPSRRRHCARCGVTNWRWTHANMTNTHSTLNTSVEIWHSLLKMWIYLTSGSQSSLVLNSPSCEWIIDWM